MQKYKKKSKRSSSSCLKKKIDTTQHEIGSAKYTWSYKQIAKL